MGSLIEVVAGEMSVFVITKKEEKGLLLLLRKKKKGCCCCLRDREIMKIMKIKRLKMKMFCFLFSLSFFHMLNFIFLGGLMVVKLFCFLFLEDEAFNSRAFFFFLIYLISFIYIWLFYLIFI